MITDERFADVHPERAASHSVSTETDYLRLCNSRNAKLVALVVLLLISIYHTIVRLNYGEETCAGLLQDGRYQGAHIWQPYGCMLHMYSQANSRMCMKYAKYWGHENRIIFAGGEREHQLYADFVSLLDADQNGNDLSKSVRSTIYTIKQRKPDKSQMNDSRFLDKNLNLTVEFLSHPLVDDNLKRRLNSVANSSHKPRLLVLGWSVLALNDTDALDVDRNLEEYTANISGIVPMVSRLKTSTVLWLLQPPVTHTKAQSDNFFVRNSLIRQYNDVSEEALFYTGVKLWRSMRLLSQGYHADSADGLQIGKVALNYDSQILMNLYCNDMINFSDGTCCSKNEPVTNVQIAAFAVFGLCILFLVVVSLCLCKMPNCDTRPYPKDDTGSNGSRFSTVVAVAKLCALMFFFFACDRANVFMKENKWYTLFNLSLPIVYLAVLGLFFVEEVKKTSFMHREQTDEWKGWMQLALLCYNMTGASQVTWIYMLSKLMISGYLFLLGFGHFSYFWNTGDFSLRRVFKVLFRYNLLVVLLCVAMNRPYQFYYYVPLASYWFLVCYAILVCPPHVTSTSVEGNPMHYLVMILKFVVLYGVVSILYLSESWQTKHDRSLVALNACALVSFVVHVLPTVCKQKIHNKNAIPMNKTFQVFFEKVFVSRSWKALFVTSDDSIQQWWFRWWLDRYSAANGMVLAFAVSFLRKMLILTDSQPCNLFSKRLSIFVVFLSLLGFTVYGVFLSQCYPRTACTEIHAYISFVPIVSYLLLRNLFGCVRTKSSNFFSWFGRISLELITAQYHVWLAADGAGVLVVFPRWPVFNVIITSFIFICVAHEIQRITQQLIPILIPVDKPSMLCRNLALLTVVLLSLASIYGLLW